MYILHTYTVSTQVTPHERSAFVARSHDRKWQCDMSICRVCMAYETMPRRIFNVPFLPVAYQLRLNDIGVSRSMHWVRAAYVRRTLRWRYVTTTTVRRRMTFKKINLINHAPYTNSTIASKITLCHSFKSHGRGSENSCCGFAVGFAPEWKTKKAGRKIEAREKHCSLPHCKKEGATASEVFGEALASL